MLCAYHAASDASIAGIAAECNTAASKHHFELFRTQLIVKDCKTNRATKYVRRKREERVSSSSGDRRIRKRLNSLPTKSFKKEPFLDLFDGSSSLFSDQKNRYS